MLHTAEVILINLVTLVFFVTELDSVFRSLFFFDCYHSGQDPSEDKCRRTRNPSVEAEELILKPTIYFFMLLQFVSLFPSSVEHHRID
jgi:hypothetical protein